MRATFPIVLLVLAAADPTLSVAEDAVVSPSFQLIGTEGKPLTITVAELKKLPRTTVDVIDRKGQPVKYTGVALRELLTKAKIPQGEELRDHWLRGLVSIESKDDYRVVFALPELDPAFTDRVIILADEQNGQPLDESRGPFQIIVPGEKRHARWIKMVTKIRVLDSLWADEGKPTVK